MDTSELIYIVDKWSSSFLRPHIPPKLLSNSTISKMEDGGAKLIYAKFLYGEKTGTQTQIPFDGSLGNIISSKTEESLWLYNSKGSAPAGFEEKTLPTAIIRTGGIKKCHVCRGHGKVTCSMCNGRIRWTEKNGAELIQKICSCGDGKELCGTCDGFGDLETVIEVETAYKVFETKNFEYNGEIPAPKIKQITGTRIFEEIIEYPKDELQMMLIGGINENEFHKVNNNVLNTLHNRVDAGLIHKAVNMNLIHEQIDNLFNTVPNPAKQNKLLEKEIIPVRVLLRVEDASVTQVHYSFKASNYTIYVYGNENRIWHQQVPFSFNYKLIILSAALLTLIAVILIISLQNQSETY